MNGGFGDDGMARKGRGRVRESGKGRMGMRRDRVDGDDC